MRNKFDSTGEEIDLLAHESTGCEYGPYPSDKGHALEMRMVASRFWPKIGPAKPPRLPVRCRDQRRLSAGEVFEIAWPAVDRPHLSASGVLFPALSAEAIDSDCWRKRFIFQNAVYRL